MHYVAWACSRAQSGTRLSGWPSKSNTVPAANRRPFNLNSQSIGANEESYVLKA